MGPTGRGEFDERALSGIEGMGSWMKFHGRSICGCTQALVDIPTPQDCWLTYNPAINRLCVHVLTWPFSHLFLDGLMCRVDYAQLLNDASEIRLRDTQLTMGASNGQDPAAVIAELPIKNPDVANPAIELFLKD